jgi:outer membrane protein assembly factor BamB
MMLLTKSFFTKLFLLLIFSATVLPYTWNFSVSANNSSLDNWPMFRHDLMHTGYSTSTAPATFNLLWNYTTRHVIWASPSVVDGYVYIASDDRNVYCLNATTGEKIWNYSSRSAFGSSAAVIDGRLYLGAYDRNVYCLNASTGAKIWNFTTRATVQSSPAVAYGFVYVGSWDGNVYCLDAQTGEKIWNYTTCSLV